MSIFQGKQRTLHDQVFQAAKESIVILVKKSDSLSLVTTNYNPGCTSIPFGTTRESQRRYHEQKSRSGTSPTWLTLYNIS